MKSRVHQEETGPETPPPFERRVVIGRRQAAGLCLMLAVPVLALARLLGDRVERHEARAGDWLLIADVPVCARDGDPLHITVSLSRADGGGAASMSGVDLSADYLERFADVRQRPAVFTPVENAGRANKSDPLVIELTPDRFGWARGRLGVTTETGERLELELNTFVFP